jgi:hypothetical protein
MELQLQVGPVGRRGGWRVAAVLGRARRAQRRDSPL